MLPFELTKVVLMVLILSYGTTCLTISYRDTSFLAKSEYPKMDYYGN